MRKLTSPVVAELQIKQVASLLLLHKNTFEIAKELSVSFNRAKELIASPAVRAIVNEAGDAAVVVARNTLKREVAGLTDLIIEVLKEHLEQERSLEAIKIALPIIGMKELEQKGDQNTAITVVMPGGETQAIEVPNTSEPKGL